MSGQTLEQLLQRKEHIEQELDVYDAVMQFLRLSLQSPADMVELGVVPAEFSPLELIAPQRVDGEVVTQVLQKMAGWTEGLQAEYGQIMRSKVGGTSARPKKRRPAKRPEPK